MSIIDFLTDARLLTVGDRAPALTVTDDQGVPVDLAAVYGSGLTLIYFYPKADTPGCTAQACSLRDSFTRLQEAGLQIFGVSSDRPDDQKKFRTKFHLPFSLLADEGGRLAKAFGVPTLLGHPKRRSYLVREGRIAWISQRVKPSEHAAEIRSALDSLRKT